MGILPGRLLLAFFPFHILTVQSSSCIHVHDFLPYLLSFGREAGKERQSSAAWVDSQAQSLQGGHSPVIHGDSFITSPAELSRARKRNGCSLLNAALSPRELGSHTGVPLALEARHLGVDFDWKGWEPRTEVL